MTRSEFSQGHAFHAVVGGVRRPIVTLTTRNAINELATAEVALESSHQQEPVDMAAGLVLIASSGEDGNGRAGEDVIFTGHALSAQPEPGGLRVHAESGRTLVEARLGLLGHAGVPPVELIHFLARQSGLSDDRVSIEALDRTIEETYVVEQFVQGVRVETVVEGPEVTISPVSSELAANDLLGQSLTKVSERWGQPSARAKTQVKAPSLFSAYELGMGKIAVALDTLLATAVYGLTQDPWGRELAFERNSLLARPSAIPFVAITSLSTSKRICSSTEASSISTGFDVDGALERWSEILNGNPSDSVARGLRALRDAADESRDIFDRSHALSTALEYYAATSRPDRVLSRKARRAAIAALNALTMEDEERQRLIALVNEANNPPLMAKIRHQVEIDGVPVSDSEWALLKQLRTIRNRTVHGHVPTKDLPDGHALRWGVSVTSRLLLFRWAADSSSA